MSVPTIASRRHHNPMLAMVGANSSPLPSPPRGPGGFRATLRAARDAVLSPALAVEACIKRTDPLLLMAATFAAVKLAVELTVQGADRHQWTPLP